MTIEKQLIRLIHIASQNSISVVFMRFKSRSKGLFCSYEDGDKRIGIRVDMSVEEYVYTLAHELAHYFLHYDKGDIIVREEHEEYEEQADRAANMLLCVLSVE